MLIAAALAVVAICVGAGIVYVANDGWPGQKKAWAQHEFYPLFQLRHGNRQPFDAENALRKREGRPLLIDPDTLRKPPEERAHLAAEARQKAIAAGQ